MLNSEGEFLTAADGNKVLEIAEKEDFCYAEVDHLGKVIADSSFDDRHVQSVLDLNLVDADAVRQARFTVCVDSINSVGGIILPKLLERLGVGYKFLNGDVTGDFAHNPEPLEKNLSGIMNEMKTGHYNLGIVVDPDVDRLAFICEDGTMFGEEYTLVSVADYVLSQTTGNTVSNLSSTRALRDVTESRGGHYSAAAVGEVNVTTKMKEVGAVIGGEGNGGVIYPELHYGRDALVGTALFLTQLAEKKVKCSELKQTYPLYVMSKNKIQLTPSTDVDGILAKFAEKFKNEKVTTIDGVKIDFEEGWVHLRKSNTEPIIRIYSEGKTEAEAERFANMILEEAKKMV